MQLVTYLVLFLLASPLVSCGKKGEKKDLQIFHEEVSTPEESKEDIDRQIAHQGSTENDPLSPAEISPLDPLPIEPIPEESHVITGPTGNVIYPSQIVNIGKNGWNVIIGSKGVSDASTDFANGLPKGTLSSMELSGASSPQHLTLRYYAKNGLGTTIIDVRYSLVFQYGADYEGTGKYLTTVSVVPVSVNVGFGFNVDFKIDFVQVTNRGTAENPVAGMYMQGSFITSSNFQTEHNTIIFEISGDSAKAKVITSEGQL
jgi:hypothetical protein